MSFIYVLVLLDVRFYLPQFIFGLDVTFYFLLVFDWFILLYFLTRIW